VRDRPPGGVDSAGDIVLVNHPPGDAHHAAAVDRGDVGACQADQGGQDFDPGSALGFIHRTRHRLGGGFQVDHHTLAHALRRFDAHTQDTQPVKITGLAWRLLAGDQGADFGSADINANQNLIFYFHSFFNRVVATVWSG
jgi:hypothetical protein